MADKYCSAQFKTGEELDAALKAALDTCDYSVAASECRQAAEKHKTEAGVSEHNAEVYAEGGKLEAHEGQTVSPEEIPGAKGYMTEARSHKFVAGIQAENAKAYAEGGIPQQDVGDGMFVGGMPTLGAKGYADHAKVYVEGGEAPMTPPELGDGVVRSHGAKNLADRAAAYSVGGDYREYYPGGTWETIHVDKGAMQYAEEARLAAEQTKKDVQDASNSADEAENFAIEARKMYMNAADAYSGAAAASGWAKSYKDEAAESAAAAAKSAEEAKKAAESGGGGGVSSWNDLTDKPFGTEIGEVAILPETAIEFDPESGEGAIADVLPVVTGNTYTVYWNGTEYTCVAGIFEMEGVPLAAIGNLGAMTGEGATDEPFVLIALPAEIAAQIGVGCGVYAIDGSTSATVSITEQGETVKKIDAKYMPDSVPHIDSHDEVIMAETYVEGSDGMGTISTPIGKLVADGRYYNVTLNGVTYACRARTDGANEQFAAAIGRTRGGGEGSEDYDLPFMISVLTPAFAAESGFTAVVTLYGETSGTIGINGWYKIHKIDERCLPDSFNSGGGNVDFTETDPTVPDWAKQPEKPTYTAEEVGALPSTFAETDPTVPDWAKQPNKPAYTVSEIEGAARTNSPAFTGSFSSGGSSATGERAVAMGMGVEASGRYSFATGLFTDATGICSFAEGYNTIASGSYQHVFGFFNIEQEGMLLIVGNGRLPITNEAGETVERRSNAHTLSDAGNAWFAGDVYVGSTSGVDKDEGSKKLATEEYVNGVAMGNVSVVAGVGSEGTGDSAEVFNGGAAENASGDYAHAEGSNTIASGYAAHAEGQGSQATNFWSHAEGYECRSTGLASHAEGMGTIAASSSQHAEGSYNIEDADDKYLHIVGNGSSDTDRTNAHTLDWDGNAWFAGTVEGTALILKSPSGKRFRITVDDSGNLSATAAT